MKKMKNIIATLIIAMYGFTSCTDWLALAPEDTLSSAIYYTNAQEILTGVMSAYGKLHNMYHHDQLPRAIEDISDDCNNFYFGNSAVNLFAKTFNESYSGVWQHCYQMIFRCNYMIAVIDGGNYTAVSDADKRNIRAMYGELHFLRALAYFNMVRFYGPVPLTTQVLSEPIAAFGVGRAPVAEIYNDVIIPGLEQAIADCYLKSELSTGQIGRATRGAAQTLLAKVYLTPPVKDLNKAKTQLEGVINSRLYTLCPTYLEVFSTSNKNHSESIFEVHYNTGLGFGSEYFRWMTNEACISQGLSGGGSNINVSNLDLYPLLKANEERYHAACDSGGLRAGEWYYSYTVKKHVTYGTGSVSQNHNWPLLRYADVMLLYAEVLLETGGSKSTILEYVNPIRTRAKTPAWAEADVTFDNIMLERRLELCFEGHRWFDLLRQGNAKTIEVMENHFRIMEDGRYRQVREEQLLFPIPLGQIQIDPTLEQNPGY
jgi:hypothetical protein